MSFSEVLPRSFSLRAIVNSLPSLALPRDPFGITSGFRIYHAYTVLDGKSDAELASMGLKRTDVPQAALKAVENQMGA